MRSRVSFAAILAIAVVLAAVLFTSSAAADLLPVKQFGGAGSEAGKLDAPGGLAGDPDTGDIYVADSGNNRIDKFSAEGEFIRAFGWGVENGKDEFQTCESSCRAGLPGSSPGQLYDPEWVAVSPVDGDVYVLNRGDGRVERFTANGEFLKAFGGYGAGQGEFTGVSGIAVGPDGTVHVADPGKSRIANFDSSGAYVSAYEAITVPAITVDTDGRLLGPASDSVVVVCAPDGTTRSLFLEPHGTPYSEVVGVAPGLTTGAFVLFIHTPSGTPGPYVLREYDGDGGFLDETVLSQLAESPPYPSVAKSIGIATVPGQSFDEHLPGAVYVADNVTGLIHAVAAGEDQVPRVSAVRAVGLGSTYADLRATVNPEGLRTEYAVEYGTTAAYGSKFPSAPASLEPGFSPAQVNLHIHGLAPATTYHYKLVAINELGTTASADQTFTTAAPGPGGGSAPLPDGRAYEQVSPVDKGNYDVEARSTWPLHGIAGAGESGLAYDSLTGLPHSPSGSVVVTSGARRGATGWSSSSLSAPDLTTNDGVTGEPGLVSADLNEALVHSFAPLTPDAKPGYNYYLHTVSPPGFQLITPDAGASSTLPTKFAVGASTDFGRVYFGDPSPLTSDSPSYVGYPQASLYEWNAASGLRNVGILPGQEAPYERGATIFAPEFRPVPEDGSAVVFGAEVGEPFPGTEQVFRRAGTETIEVSAPNPGVSDPAGPQPARFVGASADGSVVFFTSSARLTADADTGEGGADLAPNLYRYDVATEELTDLTPTGGGFERGAAVSNAVVAADGGVVYFVAEGDLAPGATPGSPNLYRWREGGGIEFIATVRADDSVATGIAEFVSFQGSPGLSERNEGREVATDSTGSAFAFVSKAGLAGNPVAAGTPEIYHWAEGEGLACVSCGSGQIGTGATMPGPAVHLPGGAGHPMSEDGRKVFFSTIDALVAADTNGNEDAYEWNGGTVSLLSSGTSSSPSYFIDANASGRDAYFATRERLVGSDVDNLIDVYDAREGGGFPEPASPPPCEGEGCRAASPAPPAGPQIGSRGNSGGEKSPKPKKKPRHHHKKKKHHKKKHHKQRHHHQKQSGRQSNKAHSGGKRG